MSDNKISAGSYDLNKWLFGGYEKDIITTIYGASGSGKTNLCIIVAVSQAIKGKKVIFVDTEGGFSSDRVKQIVTAGNNGNKETFEKVLANILLLKPVNFQEQKESIEQLLKEIKKENNIGIIIIDGMTMLYRLELGDFPGAGEGEEKEKHVKETNRELARQLRVLAEIARNKNIPIIVTNQVYNTYIKYEDREKGIIPEVRMVGGDLLKYWSKCIIRVENLSGKRKLALIKHRSLREKELEFTITDSGIKRKGWM
ncbi:MAG: DNA repair and recombination protein RadB [Nanoarchaeota archaeon]